MMFFEKHDSVYKCQNPKILARKYCAVDTKKYSVYDYSRISSKTTSSPVKYRSLHTRCTDLVVRCGKCDACRKYQNDLWYSRLRLEGLCKDNIGNVGFLTLTFNDRHLPFPDNCLVWNNETQRFDNVPDYTGAYNDYIVPFKKRLRAERGENLKFSYYCTSEFGEEKGRFHFHIVMFLRDIRTTAFITAANNYASLHPERSFRIKTDKEGHTRPMTPVEMYLQYKFLRQWIDSDSRKDNKSLDSRIYTEYKYDSKKKRTVKSMHAYGEIGHVTFFIAEGCGMLKYTTNYALKCQHDGIKTYHRQSPGLGNRYVIEHPEFKTILSENPVVIDGGIYKGKRIWIPTPKYFRERYFNQQKRIDDFWKYISSQKKFTLDLCPKDESLSHFCDDGFDIDPLYNKFYENSN